MNFLHRVKYKTPQQASGELVEAITHNHVVVLEGMDMQFSYPEFYAEVADEMGRVVPANEDLRTGGQTGERWIDISYDPAIPDRYRTANVHQPLHTDASYMPDKNCISFFYCTSCAPLGGATQFLDNQHFLQAIEYDHKLDMFERLKSIDVCFSKAGNRSTLPIITEDHAGLSFNYNYYCLDDQNTDEAKDLVDEFQVFLENRIRNSGIPEAVKLLPGEAVFFHDSRILHGRNAFFADKKGARTLIKGVVGLDG